MRAGQVIHIGNSKRIAAHLLAVAAILCKVCVRLFCRRAQQNRVVILEPFGLGDVVSHEPLVRLLIERHWDVTFCGAAEWRSLFPGIPWVNAEIAWGRHARGEKYKGSAYLSRRFRSFLFSLRQTASGGIGIDTRGDIRSVLLLYLAGCREVLTLSNYLGSDLQMPGAVGTIVGFQPDQPRWASNVRFAERLTGESGSSSGPAFPHLRSQNGRPMRRLCLMPVAPWPGKWWVPARWQELVTVLKGQGWDLFGLAGPGQRGLAVQQLGDGVEVTECTSVQDWANQLQKAAFLVTLDSGPMHLAAALDIPVVALFGQGQLPLWAPPHPRSEVVTHQSDPDFRVCAPIEANTAIGQEFMRRITVDEVLAAIDRLAAGRTQGSATLRRPT
jgi:ADP-heptose:LPS heptosyltransferase